MLEAKLNRYIYGQIDSFFFHNIKK